MKNLSKTALFTVAILSSLFVNASEIFNVKVAPSSKLLSIELMNVIEGETLVVKDNKGEILFFEELNKSVKYQRVFSFKELPKGIYFVENRSLNKIEVNPLVVKEDGVDLLKESSKTYLTPQVNLEDKILTIDVDNYSKVPVSIYIYDEFGVLQYSTENNTQTFVHRSYEISSLHTNKLIVSVSEGEEDFVKNINL